MENIDIVYYINLEHREDRKKQFLDWILNSEFPEEKIFRINAVYTKGFGIIGCGQSHIIALEEFIKSPYNNCIIYEDDYEPINKKNYWEHFRKFFMSHPEYDMLLCSHNALQSRPSEYDDDFERVKYSATASGYLITKDFAPKLLENLKEGSGLLIKTREKKKYSNDVWWNKLFEKANIYCFKKRIGFQRCSFSDIENKIENYNV
jgi:hypothetical protein